MWTPEQTLKVIGDASLLLSTSDGEGFPSVFLEAWAAGTPVVSIQIDPDHKIRDGELGVVAGTVDGAVDAVRSLDDIHSASSRHGDERAGVMSRKCIVRLQRFERLSPLLQVYSLSDIPAALR